MRRWLVKAILKVMWTIGGDRHRVHGLPRLTGRDVEAVVPLLAPGDLVLIGNDGGLSHIAVHIGDGEIVHAMATENTMRGVRGSLWDALKRPIRFLFGIVDNAGVLQESLVQFVDRFERDTFVVLRGAPTAEGRARALAFVKGLVGKRYDYLFTPGDDDYYCTEVALDFMEVALGKPLEVPSKDVRVPLLLSSEVIEPLALWGPVPAVLANEAARAQFADRLDGVQIV